MFEAFCNFCKRYTPHSDDGCIYCMKSPDFLEMARQAGCEVDHTDEHPVNPDQTELGLSEREVTPS